MAACHTVASLGSRHQPSDLTIDGTVRGRFSTATLSGWSIATFEDGAKVAYLRNPDGNTLSIAQESLP